MTHYGRLADYKLSGKDVEDIRGSALYGLDDKKLGKIDDVIFDHTTGDIRYIVVDTGGWLSSKKFIVSSTELRPSIEHKNDYRVDLTKTQIESFPPYDENALESQEKWGEYENRYRTAYADSSVHQPGATRHLSPSAGGVGSPASSGVGSMLGARWTAFENHLRSDREGILSHCRFCATRPGVERAEVSRERKVG